MKKSLVLALVLISLAIFLLVYRNPAEMQENLKSDTSETHPLNLSRENESVHPIDDPQPAELAVSQSSENKVNSNKSLEKDTIRVFGTVLIKETNQAAVGAEVGLNAIFRDNSHVEERTKTDTLGAFSFTVSRQGIYYYHAETETHAYLPYSNGMDAPVEPHGNVHIKQDTKEIGPLTIFIEPVTPFFVKVVDARDQKPVVGAAVKVSDGFWPELNTDENGMVRFMLPPLILDFEARAPGFAISKKTTNLSGDLRNIVLPLQAGGVISGRVTDETGLGIPDVSVFFDEMAFVNTDDRGYYGLDHAPLNRNFYGFFSHKSYHAKQLGALRVPESGELKLDVVLYPLQEKGADAIFMARVVDEEDQPVLDFMVIADGPNGIVPAHMDGQGRFSLQGLKLESTYYILLEAQGFRRKSVSGKPFKKEDAPLISLVMQPGFHLSGEVTDEKGRPLVAKLEVLMGLPPVPLNVGTGSFVVGDSTESASDGSFFIDQLPEVIGLRVTAEGYSRSTIPAIDLDHDGLKIKLAPASLFRGRLIDKETSEPVTNFQYRSGMSYKRLNNNVLDSIPDEYRWIETADKNGELLINPLNEGDTIGLEIKADGYQTLIVDPITILHVNEAEKEAVALKISPSKEPLQGIISFTDGTPAPGVDVYLVAFEKSMMLPSGRINWEVFESLYKEKSQKTTTNGDGAFSLPMPGDTMTFELFLEGGGVAKRRVLDAPEMLEKQDGPLFIAVGPEARISGQCNLKLHPEARTIKIQHINKPALFWSVAVEDEGAFLLSGVPEGSYELSWQESEIYSSSAREVKEQVSISLVSGELLELRLGFNETYDLSGVAFVGSQALSGGKLFLFTETNGNEQWQIRSQTQTDGGGRFVFEKLKPGPYKLVAFESITEFIEGAVQHSNYLNVTIDEVDLERSFHFQKFSRISGAYSKASEGVLVLISKNVDEGNRFQNAELRAGHFLFTDVPPGVYDLHFSNSSSNLTLVSNLQVVVAEDQDLGDLAVGTKGSLKVLLENGETMNGVIALIDGQGDGFPIYHNFREGNPSTVEEISAGLATLRLQQLSPENVWVSDTISVAIMAGATSEVVLKPHPITLLFFQGVDHSRQFTSARLIGETNLDLPLVDDISVAIRDASQSMGFFKYGGFAMYLPEGSWTLEVVFSSGEKKQIPVELIMGKMTKVQIK